MTARNERCRFFATGHSINLAYLVAGGKLVWSSPDETTVIKIDEAVLGAIYPAQIWIYAVLVLLAN